MVAFWHQAAAHLGRGSLKASLDGYCRLETAHGDTALVADDGSMVSLFRLDGFRSLPGEEDVTEACDRLRVGLSPFFSKPGLALQFWFGHSPELGTREVETIIDDSARVARDNALDLHDLLDERRKLLPSKLYGERCYLALWSRPSLLTAEDRSASQKQRTKVLNAAPPISLGQIPDTALEGLAIRHDSFVTALGREFGAAGIALDLLDNYEALNAIRKIVAPDTLGLNHPWRATLPGDYLKARLPSLGRSLKRKDISNLVWPKLSEQIFTDHADVIDGKIVRIGNTVFSGFDIVLPPEIVVQFNELIRRVIANGTKISWRCSILMESGGFAGQVFREQLARLLAWTAPTHNGRIKESFERLRQTDGDGNTVIRWRASFAAWAPADEVGQLRAHVSSLQEMVKSWGNCHTNAVVGDPLDCVMSSALGLSTSSTAESCAADLLDVLAMAPIVRPACPWERGSIIFRTADGKPFPYQPGSSKQNASVDIMVGTPGSGKSVLMNAINLGVALSPQSGRGGDNQAILPRIAIIDIGPSSSGLISLIRDALPPNRRHEAMFHRLKMVERDAVNPFDTQLCCRRPFAHERSFLVNLIALICTPEDADAPYDGISQLAEACVDEAYRYYSDEVSPKRYSPTMDLKVDDALKKHHFEVDEETSWWEIVDFLFAKGEHHAAALAQRLAVPILGDLIPISNAETVREPFIEMRVQSTQEPMVGAFQRQITAAIKQYVILSNPTRFDVSNARVVAFDLAGVTEATGKRGRKQTAVMYMMARQTLTSDFWLDEDEIKASDLPEEVRSHHLLRFQNNRQMPKRICIDEYHLTGGLGIRDQVVADVRVGRKAGVQISLASQLIGDFDHSIRELATNIFLCNVPTAESVRTVMDTYDLPASLKPVISRLTGPEPGEGAPIVAIFKLKSQTYVQHFYNQLGPIELWALSTTAEDTALRAILYERLGSPEARRILARRFPAGSAKSEIEAELEGLMSSGQMIDDSVRSNVIARMADDLVKGAFQ
ncbi:ATP-binding protein [uncultured Tateyamaria sp.]|uniref:ATP-binding protein n=1 Tax=uncultured Tateyamaria sp. TaxID=455651 RepID=UPI00260A8D1D|nr:ATP-binding protein [uncultured Tateyamaria sp.]